MGIDSGATKEQKALAREEARKRLRTEKKALKSEGKQHGKGGGYDEGEA